MAPTLVAVAVGALLAAALLGAAFDRRSVLVVAFAATLPDLDAVAALAIEGATNALLHTLVVPAVAAAVLIWDLRLRETSWLRARYGCRGARVAWVALAAYVVAGIGLDLFAGAGVNLLYPIHDRFYVVDGRFLYSTHDGVVQSYLFDDRVLASPGTTADHHVGTWIAPGEGDRRLRIVDAGWQVVVVLTAAAVLAIRLWEVEQR